MESAVSALAKAAKAIYDAVETTKQNRKQALLLAEHVRFIQDQVLSADQSVNQDLVLAAKKVFDDALRLVRKHDHAKVAWQFLKSGSYSKEFESIHQRLDFCGQKFSVSTWRGVQQLHEDLESAAATDRKEFDELRRQMDLNTGIVLEAVADATAHQLVDRLEDQWAAFGGEWAACQLQFPNDKLRPVSGLNAALAAVADRVVAVALTRPRASARRYLQAYGRCLQLDSPIISKYLSDHGHAQALGAVCFIGPLDALNRKTSLLAPELAALPLDNWGAVLLHMIDAEDRVHLEVLERCFSDRDADEPFGKRDAVGLRDNALAFLDGDAGRHLLAGAGPLVQQYAESARALLRQGAWLPPYDPASPLAPPPAGSQPTAPQTGAPVA
eukprot:m.31223 g.31223  ORF g.31223 m.31223 type:complete len:385 (+) comp4862_c0_seq1:87-1241(+)